MICPTRLRGLSEAYGSWKIICIWGRSGRRSRRDNPMSSRPANRTDPDVGAVSCRITRHSVDLPQPNDGGDPAICGSRVCIGRSSGVSDPSNPQV
jgi:hypothetical protein